LKHPIQLEEFVHCIFLQFLVLVFKELIALTTTAAQKIKVCANLVVIPSIKEIPRILVTQDEQLIMHIQL
jgi:hypothetical protein